MAERWSWCRLPGMRPVLALLAAVLYAVPAAFADNSQAILPHGSPVVELADEIALEQGRVLLSHVGPYSVDEVRGMLAGIDPSALSPAGRLAYQEAERILRD